VPIGTLQILASQMMRKLQAWRLVVIAAAIGLMPCGFGLLIGLPAGIWTLVVLNDPKVRDAFSARAIAVDNVRL
jgi:hypothetical protein